MTSHDSHTYKHKKLAHTDSIRLLELLPGPKGSPLVCNIFQVRKAAEPEYEALSYAWGDPVFSHPVQEKSSGKVLHVTTNLQQALQAIRYEHATRTLWIDAICINQSDLTEKGHQVALMGRIFHDARTVVVWLGCQKCAPTRAVRVLEDFVAAIESWDPHELPSSTGWPTHMKRLHILQFFEQSWFV
jgi:hypothetical protein